MDIKKKTAFSWSTGKDAALALYHLQKDSNFEVGHLLTTINSHYNRVSMHGLQRSLFESQARSIGLPFSTVELPVAPKMNEYEELMDKELIRLQSMGFTHLGYGDIFLQDLRDYREKALEKHNLQACFPLWKKNTSTLLETFLSLNFKAVVIAINADLLPPSFVGRIIDQHFINDLPPDLLPPSFVGRIIDQHFINDLPPGVDPCGENGEFHTFCFDGPIFQQAIEFTIGDIIEKQYSNYDQNDTAEAAKKFNFLFCDIIPK